MKLKNIKLIAKSLIVLSAIVSAQAAIAAWPSSQRITLMIASSAGGVSHRFALALQPVISDAFDMPVEIKLKPGAEGTIASLELQNCQRCILLASAKPIKDRVTPRKVDITKDILPLVYLGSVPLVIFVKNGSVYNTMESIIESTDKVSFGIAMNNPLRGPTRKIFTSRKALEVAYKGGGDVLRGVLTGEIDAGVSTADALAPLEKAGKLKVLAVIGNRKSTLIENANVYSPPKINPNMTLNSFFLFTSNNEDTDFRQKVKTVMDSYLISSASNGFKAQFDLHSLVKQDQYKILLNEVLSYE